VGVEKRGSLRVFAALCLKRLVVMVQFGLLGWLNQCLFCLVRS
jgi:hypothetical protein